MAKIGGKSRGILGLCTEYFRLFQQSLDIMLKADSGIALAQLAQAYIHLKPYRASDKKIRALGRSAERLAIKTAARVYGGGVEIEVELEEGSLRTRITVYGAIAIGIYSGVANYSGFKQSVSELCEDAREFAVDICKPFVKKADASDDQVYRFERRLKTPGKLRRLSRHLQRLERQAADLSSKNMSKELAAARRELEEIASDLSPEELQHLERAIIPKQLPPPRHWPKIELPKVAAKPHETQDDMFDGTPDRNATEAPRRIIFHKITSVPLTKKRAKTKREDLERAENLLPRIDDKH